MRKVLAILTMALLVMAGLAYATQDSGTVSTFIGVASNFDLDLGATSIDYGFTEPGSFSSQKQVSVTTVSNTGVDWELRMQASALVDGANEIPIENVKLLFSADEAAVTISDFDFDVGTKKNLTSVGVDEVLYNSGAGETGQLYNALITYVDVPGEQPAGSYEHVITITMIETP